MPCERRDAYAPWQPVTLQFTLNGNHENSDVKTLYQDFGSGQFLKHECASVVLGRRQK